ncbi:hypothetical protein I4F81_008323 [Pyropia yezoensis]|uniref:Uncharacterized protein n=1 Tax=Pyropia yezoensis TaxID=2788 RepID=A0ACC3C6F7_PYRYE|nr:hypothetical protein I4F81_008323 [Neopyropia yezoensis]
MAHPPPRPCPIAPHRLFLGTGPCRLASLSPGELPLSSVCPGLSDPGVLGRRAPATPLPLGPAPLPPPPCRCSSASSRRPPPPGPHLSLAGAMAPPPPPPPPLLLARLSAAAAFAPPAAPRGALPPAPFARPTAATSAAATTTTLTAATAVTARPGRGTIAARRRWPALPRHACRRGVGIAGGGTVGGAAAGGGGPGRGHDRVAASATPTDIVVAITRGGMIPATLLCERLGKRTLVSATVMLYTDAGQKFYGLDGPRFLNFPDDEVLSGRHVLVVDDVWDSGVTALSVAGRCGRSGAASVKVAVLHYKPERGAAAGAPDYFAQTTESWVVYPWEPVPE